MRKRHASQYANFGSLLQDIPFIREKAESLGMEFVHHREKNNWAAVKFIMK